MPRIHVSVTESQREWIDRVANETDDTRSDVIQRVLEKHRTGGSEAQPDTSNAKNGDPAAGSDQQSREQLLKRIESLEESLRTREEPAETEEDDDDGAMGWR